MKLTKQNYHIIHY